MQHWLLIPKNYHPKANVIEAVEVVVVDAVAFGESHGYSLTVGLPAKPPRIASS